MVLLWLMVLIKPVRYRLPYPVIISYVIVL